MLPALGVLLPPKAALKGGTVDTSFAISGPVNQLVATGSIRMQNSALANFNLGSKLGGISSLSGKNSGNDTTIQNFSSDVRVAPEGTQANNINLNVPAIGVVTGAGTVSPIEYTCLQDECQHGRHGDPVRNSGYDLRSQIRSRRVKGNCNRPAEGTWQGHSGPAKVRSVDWADCSRKSRTEVREKR